MGDHEIELLSEGVALMIKARQRGWKVASTQESDCNGRAWFRIDLWCEPPPPAESGAVDGEAVGPSPHRATEAEPLPPNPKGEDKP